MYYYQHNIGDYRKDTSHLSLLEHGIYRQLLDTYYISECPLPSDHAKLMRSHSIRTADEKQALLNVLQDFFVLTDDGYIQDRCDKEISAYHGKSEKARQSAKARWDKDKSNDANALQTQSKGNANHKPRTINQEPRTKDKSNARGSRLPADWEPTEQEIQFCKTDRPDLDWRSVADQFRDYWHGVAGSKGCKLDWAATWRNWVRGQKQGRVKAAGNGAMSAVGQATWNNGQAWLEEGNG